MIHAAIFDFGNVICSFDLHLFLRRISRFSRRSLPELQQIFVTLQDLGREYETGLITSDHFFEQVRRRAELTISKPDFIKAYCEIFTPISATFDILRRLKGTYKLGLASNTNEWHYLYGIRPVAVFPLFDAVTLSFEVKAMKPARPMYDDILSKLMLYPPECLYVDDLQENVDAARDVGMHAFRYTSHESLLHALQGLGVAL